MHYKNPMANSGIFVRICRVRKRGSFGKRGLFRKVHFLEILENLEILEILESPQTVENKGESEHFLEILENLEILEISYPVKRPFSQCPLFPVCKDLAQNSLLHPVRAGREPLRSLTSESVKCRFSKCRFSAELKKLEKIFEMGGSIEK